MQLYAPDVSTLAVHLDPGEPYDEDICEDEGYARCTIHLACRVRRLSDLYVVLDSLLLTSTGNRCRPQTAE